MKRRELERKHNEKLTDLEEEAKEKAEYLLSKANAQRLEQEDEVKHLNEVSENMWLCFFLLTTCHIRNAEITVHCRPYESLPHAIVCSRSTGSLLKTSHHNPRSTETFLKKFPWCDCYMSILWICLPLFPAISCSKNWWLQLSVVHFVKKTLRCRNCYWTVSSLVVRVC